MSSSTEVQPDLDKAHEEITHGKPSQGALKRSDDDLRALIQASPQPIIALDREYRVTAWNPAAEQLFGWKAEDVLGRFNPLATNDVRDEFRANVDPILCEGRAVSRVEVRRQRADGGWLDLSFAQSPLWDADGAVRGIMAVITDITDRKRADETLWRREQEFRALAEHSPDVIVRFDHNFRRVYVNKATERVTGVPREQLLGKNHAETGMSPEIIDFWRTHLSAVFETGAGRTADYRFPADDAVRYFESRFVPEYADDGTIKTVLTVSRDVTERKHVEMSQSFLAGAGEILASSLDMEATLAQIVELAVPEMADICSVTIAEESGELRHLALAHSDPIGDDLRARIDQGVLVESDAPFGVAQAVRTGRSCLYENIPAEVLSQHADRFPQLEILRTLGVVSAMLVPLTVQDRTLGALAFMYGDSGRHYTERDLALAEELANRAAMAIENARLHREARDAEQRYRSLIEQIPAITLIFSDERPNLVDYISPQVEALLGYGPEEWRKNSSLWHELIHPEDLSIIESALERARHTNQGFVVEYRMLRCDGRTIWVRDEAMLIRDAEGQCLFWQVMVTDITRQKQAEEEISYQAHLLDVVDQAVIATEMDGTIVYWNRFAEQLYCWTKDEVLGMRAQDAITTISTSDDAEHIFGCLRAGESWTGEFVVRDREGREFPALVTESPVFDEHGVLAGMVGVSFDISAQKQVERERERAERMLRDAEARYRSLVENMPAVTYIRSTDEPSVLTYVSPQVEVVLGYTPEDCQSQAFWREITHPDDRGLLRSEEECASEPSFHSEYRMFASDGRTVWLRDEAVLVYDEGGAPLYWQGVLLDITDRKALEGELTHQAFHDTLTGLPNRALFLNRARHARDRARRSWNGVAILFIDLDNFKIVNDSLGHTVGDQLLVAAADRLQRCLREGDTAARFGGDEFAILLEDTAGLGTITSLADRIVEVFEEPFTLQGREIFITPSIGIAMSGRGNDGPDDLLRNADAAMYRAKRLGKARYEIFDPSLTVHAMRRLELENDLRRAIERDEFVLHYHPLVSLESGDLTGVEALVRWNHPVRGLAPPGEFIRIAEETGLIVPIGRWVLREACRQAREWQREFGELFPKTIGVNLSGRQFNDPMLVEHVAEALATSGLEPRHLVLEITESATVEEYQGALQKLNALSELGVAIAIDDFGTGYSSLGVLRSLPVDALKIDRSFVDALLVDPEDTVIVSGIIGLARAMDLRVVAEGIETAQQLTQLRDLGCQIGQGYYFGKPMTAAATRSFLSAATGMRAAS